MRQWRFIANQNSMFSGINDAGIETFTADLTRSLVRETIQNALDAAIPGYAGATRVEFSLFQLPVEEIPDVGRLRAAVTMCRDSNREEPDAYRFFARAAGTLDGSSIAVLRISDQGTVGLEGSDTCAKGTGWSRLVKESGSSNKGKDSGGSFGIGKSAAFACSDLRTVFYSSLDVQGLPSNIGVAKLISFQDPDLGWTTGVGYYSEDERYVAMRELAALHEGYRRKASGTDIYILGMHMDGDFKTAFIRAVLLDFMVSVVKGKLEVVIQDEQIDRGTLAQYMARLDPHESEAIKALLIYHHILTSPDPDILRIPLDSRVYGQRYGFSDGECTLYLKEGEGFGRKILITRSAGMRILEQDRISGSIEFYGVLIIDGEKMNETFKKMEVPSHDAWGPGRCREDREVCAGALRDLKKYLKEQVLRNFGKANSASIDAFGASDFLPDRIDAPGQRGLEKSDLSAGIKELVGKEVAPGRKRARQLGLIAGGPPQEAGGARGRGGSPRASSSLPGGDREGGRTGYKKIDVKKRLTCRDVSKGMYVLDLISPSSAKYGKMVFALSGEQSELDLPVRAVQLQGGGSRAKIVKTAGNTVYLQDLTKGAPLRLGFQVDLDGYYCMMEVDHFASKK